MTPPHNIDEQDWLKCLTVTLIALKYGRINVATAQDNIDEYHDIVIALEVKKARIDELFMINKMYRDRRDESLIGMEFNKLRDIDKDLDFIADRILELKRGQDD